MPVITLLAEALRESYVLERELGRGGMATVYLARDIKHDRPVALKVLRQDLAAVIGAERFLGEIKTTAHLQHPHILPLFDSGAANCFLYYVMPCVEGESLRERLRREKQLPVDDAVRIAQEVASALEYAHRQGIIHRDIKPENIMLHDGRALVADFGIALAISGATDTRMTETGMSLGTPEYMSPEQAMGQRDIGPRSDVYALGAVLYEMLCGEPPFTGRTAQAILARVLTETPRPLSPQRHTIPPRLEEATLRALEKLPADRFAGPAEFARSLIDGPSGSPTSVRRATPASALTTRNRRLALAALGGTLVGALAMWWMISWRVAPADQPSRRYQIVLPDSAPLDFFAPSYFGDGRPGLALTPDGSTLVYVARVRGRTQLYSRRLDGNEVKPIAGTEGAADPFVSPDGAWIGFVADGELKRVRIEGGPVTSVVRVSRPQGMAWLPDGRIVDHRGWVVAASGGDWKPSAPGLPQNPGGWPGFPTVLPDNQRIAFTGTRGLGFFSLADSVKLLLTLQGTVPLDSRAHGIAGVSPWYAPTGHLMYVSDGTITALPFEARSLRVEGPPAAILSGVRQEMGGAQLAVAGDGTLVYAAGVNAERGRLVWADSGGQVRDTVPIPVGQYFDLLSSPDGRKVAVQRLNPTGGAELLIVDLERGLVRTLPLPDPAGRLVTWPAPDELVLHSRRRSVAYSLAGTRRPDTLLAPFWLLLARSPKNDYQVTFYDLSGPAAADSAGAWIFPTNGNAGAKLDPYGYGYAEFSPDGRWLAYVGHDGLYVSAVPVTGSAIQVSPESGDEPQWSASGGALYYRQGPRWMAVPVALKNGRVVAGKPRLLFTGRYLQARYRSYDVGPDGRFLLLAGPPEETTTRLEVVTNFFGELRRKAGSNTR